MLSRALRFDVNNAYGDIEKKFDAEHARNKVLTSERDALLKKVEGLEGKIKESELERVSLRAEVADAKKESSALRDEVKVLEAVRASLNEDLRLERQLYRAIGQSAWECLEAQEGALSRLGAIVSERTHSPAEVHITMERLRRGCETCVNAAHAYGDHCARATWLATLATLDKAGCAHIDGVATGDVAVAMPAEVVASHPRIRKAGRVLQREFWTKRGHDAAEASFRIAQACQEKLKTPVEVPEDAGKEVPEGGKRGSTHENKV